MLLLVTGKLVSLLGASMFTFVCGLYILQATGSGSQFAITIVCSMLPRIVLAPFAGVIVDRMNRKKIVISADIASVVVMLLGFTAITLNGFSLVFIYLTLGFLAVCSTFYSVSISSSLVMLVEEQKIQKAGSLNQLASSLGGILGPILAGLLYGFISLPVFMLINATGFLVSSIFACLLQFKVPTSTSNEINSNDDLPSSVLTSIQEGLSYVRKRTMIWTLLKLCFWINFFTAGLIVTIPYILVQTLHLSSTQYGVADSMLAFGMLLMAGLLSLLKETSDQIKSLLRGLCLLSIATIGMSVPLLLGFTQTAALIFYIVLLLCTGVIIVWINIPVQVVLQKSVETQYQGRVFGIVETMSGAIAPLGMIMFGLLLDVVPAYVIPIVSGLALLLITSIGRKNFQRQEPAHTLHPEAQAI